jgi:hypothetical protein
MRTALSRVPVRIKARRPVTEPLPLKDLVCFVEMDSDAFAGTSHHSSPAAAKPSNPSNVALARQLMTVSSRPIKPGISVLPISPEKLYWDSACLIPPPPS